jgi:anti-sigma regulatory factor (Ser/Thr protein kinase)
MVADESARLAALRRYRILDTEPERAFDDLTLLAAQVCGAPMAAISLVDADRQWFKSRLGLPMRETSRDIAFCTEAIRHPDIFVVPDALQDAQFRDNPLVAEPGIRFYAGAPLLTTDGEALGTLCVMDHEPRTLSQEQLVALDALRRQVLAQMELRRNLAELQEALAERHAAEAEQQRLVDELNVAHDQVKKLSALIPLSSACQFNMVLPAEPRAIVPVTEGVSQILRHKGWSEDEVMKVELALQEALTNAIRHGCGNDPSRHLQCCVACDEEGELMLVVRDPGEGFDAARVPNPLDPENVLKPGGRGIFLINELMDHVAFKDGGREVQMRKRREQPERT